MNNTGKKKGMTIKLTQKELDAIMNVTDNISGMIGANFDVSALWTKDVKAVDRMLKRNGFKRKYT